MQYQLSVQNKHANILEDLTYMLNKLRENKIDYGLKSTYYVLE